jgi:hypothetical protein
LLNYSKKKKMLLVEMDDNNKNQGAPGFKTRSSSTRQSVHEPHSHLYACSLRRGTLVRKTLNCVLPSDNVHQRHARYSSHPTPKFPIAGGDDVAFVRGDALDDAIVCVGPVMRTSEALKPGVSCNPIRRVKQGIFLSRGGELP